MTSRFYFFAIALTFMLTPFISVASTLVKVNVDFDDHHSTSFSLVRAALDATVNEFGPYEFQRVRNISQARAEEDLAEGKHLDMLWFATSQDREARFLTVRTPLDGGLLGHRVCLIRKGAEAKFSDIQSQQDFLKANLKIGSGDHWPDTKILKANGFQVVSSPFYSSLFQMLQSNRFDCFMRSVVEIQNELKRPENAQLTIEKHLLFVYPMPTYIFLNKHNVSLAQRITIGMEKIHENGIFQRISEKRLLALASLELNKRYVIPLRNPYLPEESELLVTGAFSNPAEASALR